MKTGEVKNQLWWKGLHIGKVSWHANSSKDFGDLLSSALVKSDELHPVTASD